MKRNSSDWMVMKGMNRLCAEGLVVWQKIDVGNSKVKRGRGSERMKVWRGFLRFPASS